MHVCTEKRSPFRGFPIDSRISRHSMILKGLCLTLYMGEAAFAMSTHANK